MIPASVTQEKGLTLQSQELADLDRLDNGFEGGSHVIVRREKRVESGTELGGIGIKLGLENLLGIHALLGEPREALGEQIRIVLIQGTAERGILELQRIRV